MSLRSDWRVLIVPTHPGVQYHFTRVGVPTYFLGHWDQFQYWRPQEANVHNLLPRFEDAHLDYGPADYARLLDDPALGWPGRYDLAWLMFNWQYKLFRDRPGKKLYRVAKVAELTGPEWDELLAREDFTVASFYPNTVEWLQREKGVSVPYIPLGLDPGAYGPWTGTEARVLSVIHTWKARGWHYKQYCELRESLPCLHVDHLDDSQEKQSYESLQKLFRSSRVYLHDGEQEYTITLIEALMTGMPIVSFRVPGIERYVQHGINGFVGDSTQQVREYCRMLLADDGLAVSMGRASRRLAEQDYSEALWKQRWLELFQAFLTR